MPDDERLRERVRGLADVLYGEACDERNTAASLAKRDAAERIWDALAADGTAEALREAGAIFHDHGVRDGLVLGYLEHRADALDGSS